MPGNPPPTKFLQIALIQCRKNSTILKLQGNHEWHYNFSNYKARFNMPHDNNKNMFFSFDIGPVHFISISTEFYYFLNYGMSQVSININCFKIKDVLTYVESWLTPDYSFQYRQYAFTSYRLFTLFFLLSNAFWLRVVWRTKR